MGSTLAIQISYEQFALIYFLLRFLLVLFQWLLVICLQEAKSLLRGTVLDEVDLGLTNAGLQVELDLCCREEARDLRTFGESQDFLDERWHQVLKELKLDQAALLGLVSDVELQLYYGVRLVLDLHGGRGLVVVVFRALDGQVKFVKTESFYWAGLEAVDCGVFHLVC